MQNALYPLTGEEVFAILFMPLVNPCLLVQLAAVLAGTAFFLLAEQMENKNTPTRSGGGPIVGVSKSLSLGRFR